MLDPVDRLAQPDNALSPYLSASGAWLTMLFNHLRVQSLKKDLETHLTRLFDE